MAIMKQMANGNDNCQGHTKVSRRSEEVKLTNIALRLVTAELLFFEWATVWPWISGV